MYFGEGVKRQESLEDLFQYNKLDPFWFVSRAIFTQRGDLIREDISDILVYGSSRKGSV